MSIFIFVLKCFFLKNKQTIMYQFIDNILNFINKSYNIKKIICFHYFYTFIAQFIMFGRFHRLNRLINHYNIFSVFINNIQISIF